MTAPLAQPTHFKRLMTTLTRAPLWQQALGVFLGAALVTAGFGAVAQTKTPVLKPMTKGQASAQITVVEYASVTCTHCAHWYKDHWPEFEAKYVKTGKVKYEFREVATSPAPVAFGVYMIANCAANKKTLLGTGGSKAYFTVVDGFMKAQEQVYKTGDVAPTLKNLSKAGGLSESEMEACLADESLQKGILARMESQMKKDNVTSTPTFFVNGKRVDGHEMSDIDAAIAAAAK